MKPVFLAAGICGVAAAIALAAQNRGFEPGGPGSRLAAAIDADRNGLVSNAEIRSSAAALTTLDVNHDRQLTGDELRFPGGRGEERGEGRGERQPISADELSDTLMAFDRNSDAKLERSEVPQRFQGLFDRADVNQDGALTKAELTQSATATAPQEDGRGRRGGREGRFGGGAGGMIDPLMRALDADGNGTLSETEIADAPRALESLDANHNGELSADELRPPPRRGFDGREGRRQ